MIPIRLQIGFTEIHLKNETSANYPAIWLHNRP